MINYTGLCECDKGWKSDNNLTDWNDYIPSTTPVQMCTVRIQDFYNGTTEILNKIILIPEDVTRLEIVSFNTCTQRLFKSYQYFLAFIIPKTSYLGNVLCFRYFYSNRFQIRYPHNISFNTLYLKVLKLNTLLLTYFTLYLRFQHCNFHIIFYKPT